MYHLRSLVKTCQSLQQLTVEFVSNNAGTQIFPTISKLLVHSRRHSMLFNKYAVSVKRHIREGICIPLDVKPDLVRNITIY